MSTYVAVQTLRVHASAKLTKRLTKVLILCVLILLLTSPTMIAAYAGLGGYISEKMLGDGVNESSLYLGDSADGPLILGSGPQITTLAVTDATFPDAGPTTATLRGNLVDLNGMPTSEVWFVWGYTPGTMVNTTAASTEVATGVKTFAIAGFDPGLTVFYQFQASTDAEIAGATMSFTAGGGRGGAYWIMRNLLPMIIAIGIFILVLTTTRNPIAALVGAIIGLVAVAIVQGTLLTMWP